VSLPLFDDVPKYHLLMSVQSIRIEKDQRWEMRSKFVDLGVVYLPHNDHGVVGRGSRLQTGYQPVYSFSRMRSLHRNVKSQGGMTWIRRGHTLYSTSHSPPPRSSHNSSRDSFSTSISCSDCDEVNSLISAYFYEQS
jgi:hypothetical protein